MKITQDKIEGWPPLTLRKKDILAILSALPREWTSEIKRVRLANVRRYHPFAFLHGGALTIYSRGQEKVSILETVLKELARNALGWQRGMGTLNHTDHQKLQPIIQPYLDALVTQIGNPYARRLVSLHGFKELKPPEVDSSELPPTQ